jgi:hypothetical protein
MKTRSSTKYVLAGKNYFQNGISLKNKQMTALFVFRVLM